MKDVYKLVFMRRRGFALVQAPLYAETSPIIRNKKPSCQLFLTISAAVA